MAITRISISEIKEKLATYDLIILKQEESAEIQQFFFAENGFEKSIYILE